MESQQDAVLAFLAGLAIGTIVLYCISKFISTAKQRIIKINLKKLKAEKETPKFVDMVSFNHKETVVKEQFNKGITPFNLTCRLINLVLHQHFKTKSIEMLNYEALLIAKSINVYNDFYKACKQIHGSVSETTISLYQLGFEKWSEIYKLVNLYPFISLYLYESKTLKSIDQAVAERVNIAVPQLPKINVLCYGEDQVAVRVRAFLREIQNVTDCVSGKHGDKEQVVYIPSFGVTVKTSVIDYVVFSEWVIPKTDREGFNISRIFDGSSCKLILVKTTVAIPRTSTEPTISEILDILSGLDTTANAIAYINSVLYTTYPEGTVFNMWLQTVRAEELKSNLSDFVNPMIELTFSSLRIVIDD